MIVGGMSPPSTGYSSEKEQTPGLDDDAITKA